MSIFSKIKSVASAVGSAVKKAYSYVAAPANKLLSTANPVAGGVASAITAYNSATKNSSSGSPAFNAVVGQNVPATIRNTGGTYPGFNAPSSSRGSIMYDTPAGPQLPSTISARTGMVGRLSESSLGGYSFAPSPTTISMSSMGATGTSSTLGGASTLGGVSPISLPSSPAGVNPGRIDNTKLAGTLAQYKKFNEATQQWEDVAVQDVQPQTMDDMARERQELYDKYLGIKPDVYDDPEVRQARAERQRLQNALQAPTAELNAVLAKQQQDLLQLRQTGSQEGVTEAVYGGQQAQINYEAAVRALPLQAYISSVTGQLEQATEYLNELTDIKTRQIDRQYEYNKMLFDSIEGLITKDEQRRYDEIKSTNERVHKEQRELEVFKTSLMQQAMQNGAPQSVFTRINSAPDMQSAVAAAGQYGMTQNTQLTQLDNGDTVLVDKNTGKVISNIGGAKSTPAPSLVGLTPEQASDPFIQKLAASAGGKPITDTFAQQLNKGLTVLGQVGLLQSNINGQDIVTPDGNKINGMKTGPLVGLFRGANPWDTKAQTIKAQLNAIIPNLARGVYSEVGVLTDNDIKTYSKTLPNLKSTEDIRNAVLGITVDLIGKSLKRNLEINAANGKDVSGFIDIYTEMQSTKDSIFSQIPGYAGTGTGAVNVTPELQSLRNKYGY